VQIAKPTSSIPQSASSLGQQSYVRGQNLAPSAAGGNPTGPQNLEQAAGSQAWSQLMGDTSKASDEANALGSQAGVEGLLQQQAYSPTNSAFDAALINGSGGPQFRSLAHQYGGDALEKNVGNAEQAAQDRWKQLQGDVDTRQAFDAAAANAPVPGAPAVAQATSTTPASPGGPPTEDGFDAATYAYGQSMADKSQQQNGSSGIPINPNGYGGGSGYSGGGLFGTDNGGVPFINVGSTANGKSSDWNGWFGGADVGNQSPQQLGLTPQEIWSLSIMSPSQRAAWLKSHHKGS
jgi:hypothetical protein